MVTGTITNPGYMRTRSVEMMLSTMMSVTGLILLWPGSTFDVSPIWLGMKAWVDEDTLGWILLGLGLIRWVALYVNGKIRQTPLLRIAGCMAGGFFWTALASSFDIHYGNGIPTLFGYAAVAAAFEVYSAVRCGTDAAIMDSLGSRTRALQAREQERRRGHST